MKAVKKEHDLTQGSIWKKLIVFFLPIIAGNLFQQLYTLGDAVIVGQFAGTSALAAIDAIYPIIRLPVNFFIGLSAGAAIIVAQYFGAKQNEDLSKAVHTAIGFAFLGGLLLSILGIVFAPYFLHLMNIPAGINPYALSYARIYFGGMAVSMLYNIGAGILRAVGDSKSPFHYLIVANCVNLGLDLLFVGAFKLHVTGAAVATVIAQLVSAILVIRALLRTNYSYKITMRKIKLHKSVIYAILTIGLPVAVRSSLYPISNIVVQSSLNGFGTDSIAAWAVCGKMDFLIWAFVDSLGAAVTTFAAQNYGAGYYARIKKGVRACLIVSLVLVAIVSAVLYIWREPLARVFISDGNVIEIVSSIMAFIAPLYFLYIGGEIFSGAIQGTGETLRPMILTLTGTCAFRIMWMVFVLPLDHTFIMALWSYPASWFVSSLLFIFYYLIFKSRHLGSRKAEGRVVGSQNA